MDIKQRWNHEADGGMPQRTIEFMADHDGVTLSTRVVLPYLANAPMAAVVLNSHMSLRAFLKEFLEALKTKDPNDIEA